MAKVINYPNVNTDGWLRRVASRLGDLRDTFKDLYQDIDDVYLLGTYLSWPFYYVYIAFYYSKQYTDSANDTLQWAYYLGKNAYEDGYVNSLIDAWWDKLKDFKDNPTEYIRAELALQSISMTYLMYYPLDWLKLYLYDLDDRFYNLVNYPSTFLYNLFYDYSNSFAEILTDPVNYIRNRIALISVDYMYLMYYPVDWVKLRLIDVDSRFYSLLYNPSQFFYDLAIEYNSSLSNFISNPVNWLKNYMSNYLGLPYGFWENPGWYFYVQLLDTVESYFENNVERLKNLLIRLILRYI